jgi:MOSC domain-containing protein YiiM
VDPARVLSVNVTHELVRGSRGSLSGIDKRPVAGRVRVGRLGVEGDVQYDKRHHGGPDQAVYAYAAEAAHWWAAEIGREVPPGQLGENLTTQGVAVTGAVVGELWRVGSTLLQPVLPRIPCRKFAAFWGVPRLVKRFTEHGDCGAYLRVLEEGEVAAGDAVEVVDRPAHGITVGDLFRAVSGDRELIDRIAALDALPDKMRSWVVQVAADDAAAAGAPAAG